MPPQGNGHRGADRCFDVASPERSALFLDQDDMVRRRAPAGCVQGKKASPGDEQRSGRLGQHGNRRNGMGPNVDHDTSSIGAKELCQEAVPIGASGRPTPTSSQKAQTIVDRDFEPLEQIGRRLINREPVAEPFRRRRQTEDDVQVTSQIDEQRRLTLSRELGDGSSCHRTTDAALR